jgi:hypothetical protein
MKLHIWIQMTLGSDGLEIKQETLLIQWISTKPRVMPIELQFCHFELTNTKKAISHPENVIF